MSRFGLRSNAENLKIDEDEKLNPKNKFCKTVTIPIKRVQTSGSYVNELNAKLAYKGNNKKKHVMKNERANDVIAEATGLERAIRLEIEKSENVKKSNIITPTTGTIGTTGLINKYHNEDVDNDRTAEDGLTDTIEVAAAAKTAIISTDPSDRTLVCRLPLMRLTDILQKLKLSKTQSDTINLDHFAGDDNLGGNEDDEEEEEQVMEERKKKTNNDDVIKLSSKQMVAAIKGTVSEIETATVKILCLYCDKKFSSHKMQLKHVDKFHCQQQDRRCSGRKLSATQVAGRKRKTVLQHLTGPQSFPGCSFCIKTTIGGANSNNPLNSSAGTSNLDALFGHLIDCHADKYFGCKTCSIRFQNVAKLSKHMQLIHKRLPFTYDETSSSKSKDTDAEPPILSEKIITTPISERNNTVIVKRNHQQQQQVQQRSLGVKLCSTVNYTVTSATCNFSTSGCASGGGSVSGIGNGGVNGNYCTSPLCVVGSSQCSTAVGPDSIVIGAEEPILSRLGLTQNRLPNNRKGIRLRRENILPEALLKSEQNSCPNFTSSSSTLSLASLSSSSSNSLGPSSITSINSCNTICSPKIRGGKAIKHTGDVPSPDVIFRIPTRNDILSCVFDDNFYKEVVANVRNNLLLHLDGKISSNVTLCPSLSSSSTNTNMDSSFSAIVRNTTQSLQVHSTLVKSPILVAAMDRCEIHAATTLAAITAFPTLLTAEQYGGDAVSSKLKRPHTKNSWKWKWDSVKKFKIVNEGGKLIKKMKHPMFGLRDLSKLDMWTQLTMRQKHENQQQLQQKQQQIPDDINREVKQRLNEQLNWILDMRLLPHIILEQNEQAIIKVENDEFAIPALKALPLADDLCRGTSSGNVMRPTFADENFLSRLNLLPNHSNQHMHQSLVLSGEWARPRCYLCMCCGSKFEKLKSLEEHKMFRHSHILSNHYEVVGRELLAGNLLRHLFIPKKALSRYGNDLNLMTQQPYRSGPLGASRRLFWQHRNERDLHVANNDESSDCSLQSVLNSCASNNCSLLSSKIVSCTEDCDPEVKNNAAVTNRVIGNSDLEMIRDAGVVVSPAHSMQSCSSSIGFSSAASGGVSSSNSKQEGGMDACTRSSINCSKCTRQCNGLKDLYRHMLDCSGDYIWTMAKKRKYRYYCGSKKRRPCNKHVLELRKNKSKAAKTTATNAAGTAEVNTLSNMNADDENLGRINTPIYSMKIKTPAKPRPSDAESIKKMLENLPPKRVCKNIYPLLTKKTVKSEGNRQLKSKLNIVKHKIFHRLRKTRMVQLTRFLAKSRKTEHTRRQQHRRRKKNATANVAPGVQALMKCAVKQHLSQTMKQSLNNETNKNKRIIYDKTITITHTSNAGKRKGKCDNVYYNQDECDSISASPSFPSAFNKFIKNDDNEIIINCSEDSLAGVNNEAEDSFKESFKKSPEKSEKNVTRTSLKEAAGSKKVTNLKVENRGQTSLPREGKPSTDIGQINTTNVITSIVGSIGNLTDLPIYTATNSNVLSTTTVPTSGVSIDYTQASRISVAPLSSLMPSSPLKNNSNNTKQVKSFFNSNNSSGNNSNTNNNVTSKSNNKRSKRINDCIAMLTGKLAQKIKSEEGSNTYNRLSNDINIHGNSNHYKNCNDSTTTMLISPFDTNFKETTTWTTTMSNVTPVQTVIMSTPEVTITKVVLQQQHSAPPNCTGETLMPPLASPMSPKRMPKRKAVSRRIIKAPMLFDPTDTNPIGMGCTVTKTTFTEAAASVTTITPTTLHNIPAIHKLPFTSITNIPMMSTLVTTCETLITPTKMSTPLSTCSNISFLRNFTNSTNNFIPIKVKPVATTASSIKQVVTSQVTDSGNTRSDITNATSAAFSNTIVASIPTLSVSNVPHFNITPVCTLNMAPQVSVYIPGATTAAAHVNLTLPVPLALPVALPLMENKTNQISMLSNTRSNSSNTIVGVKSSDDGIMPSVLPVVNDVVNSSRDQRHFSTSCSILPCNARTTNFSAEPLNLCSTSRNPIATNTNDTQDLSNGIGGGNGFVPMRRKTICGFEARNFVLHNEMEPLDLSKNSRQALGTTYNPLTVSANKLVTIAQPLISLQTVPSTRSTITTATIQPPLPQPTVLLQQFSQSLAQQQQQPSTLHNKLVVPICESHGVFTISALAPEAVNKQFYSNLDLLRIPQIRNSTPLTYSTSPNITTNSSSNDLVGLNTVIAVTTTSTIITTTTVITNISANPNTITSSASTLLSQSASKVGTSACSLIITTPKTINKKRYNKSFSNNPSINNNGMTVTNSASIDEIVNAVATSSSTCTTNSKGKDINSKAKENSKNKVILKMDEEVINHIDDAINTVINAVKASLRESEEAERLEQEEQKHPHQQQKSLDFTVQLSQYSQQPPILSESHNTAKEPLPIVRDTTTSSAIVMPTKIIAQYGTRMTPSKRNMRSKTLDCRPSTLITKSFENNNTQSFAATQQIECNNLREIKTVEVVDRPITPTQKEVCAPEVLSADIESDGLKSSWLLNQKNRSVVLTRTNARQLTMTSSEVITDQNGQSEDVKQQTAMKLTADFKERTIATTIVMEQQRKSGIIEENLEAVKIIETERVSNAPIVPSTTTVATNNGGLKLDQMSNINNTSSDFHGSFQSDQILNTAGSSITAITPFVDGPAQGTPVEITTKTKKQRKRRKNELAAIVADQLLESFKIDKARRDNLKKLENLAYEKSDDLLLTGMLLMSSTKRVVTTVGGCGASSTTIDNIANVSNSGINKRSKNTRSVNYNVEATITTRVGKPDAINKVNNTKTTPTLNKEKMDKKTSSSTNTKKVTAIREVATQSANYVVNTNFSKDQPIKSKRRFCRSGRRGKFLDNENISKLKSSLESFSIDIERQLMEFESKNVNVFKNVNNACAEVNNRSNRNITNGSAVPPLKSTVILRPSILSITLDATNQCNNSSQQASKVTNGDTNSKSIVSSRDPRLNKNIHKEKGDLLRKSPKRKTCEELNEIGDADEDNYLTEIAKNVNEKIMSNEIEEFAFKNDGFEMVHDVQDDSNSKFSRPPTSMSVRSAPNFHEDRYNFASICDENTNTNTEALDMDLDDDMSVYTSYSQDLGRGRVGRRRRRRRSLLLSRKPKKRPSSRDQTNDKIECVLCKKVFYSASSLAKHNTTLAHVSKVSEQEYLLSKKIGNVTAAAVISHAASRHGNLGPYARCTTRRATISEPLCHTVISSLSSNLNNEKSLTDVHNNTPSTSVRQFVSTEMPATVKELVPPQLMINETAVSLASKIEEGQKIVAETLSKSPSTPLRDVNNSSHNATLFGNNSRLNLNPDERLFFECCNILKGAETPRLNSHEVGNNHQPSFTYMSYNQEKGVNPVAITSSIPPNIYIAQHQRTNSTGKSSVTYPAPCKADMKLSIVKQTNESTSAFKDPLNLATVSYETSCNKNAERITHSPTYSGNTTTSRFKTKAAMKGYENVNFDLSLQQHESKSHTICKLTELAEIALGNEDKQAIGSREVFASIQDHNRKSDDNDNRVPVNNITQTPAPSQQPLCTNVPLTPLGNRNVNVFTEHQASVIPEYASLSEVQDLVKNCLPSTTCLQLRNDRNKSDTHSSSTSSKTIMHSSLIKAAVEEHQKMPPSLVNNSKIVIPDRPFKNIGLEEKESITFLKPKTPVVNLLTDDNSVSTVSFSDRDDYDFNSLSCDDEFSLHDDKHLKNGSSTSSFESSRATAKTFENKSLIMGRIFRNASTKALNVKNIVTAVKVKNVGVQKDQTPILKADLNQLFDELRGGGNSKLMVHHASHEHITPATTSINQIEHSSLVPSMKSMIENSKRKDTIYVNNKMQKTPHASSPSAVVSSTTFTPATARKSRNTRKKVIVNTTTRKSRKDISKLQSELGMSSDEIKKLIDEGQRKSKRRCATNHPKKLVEIWSSDEYEEFLSTKDIIALIEEKEQQEKRRKRKSSLNLCPSTSTDKEKVKELPSDVTSSTKDNHRRNSRNGVNSISGVNGKHQRIQLFEEIENGEFGNNGRLTKYNKDKVIGKCTAAKTTIPTKEVEPVSTTAIDQTTVSDRAKSITTLKKANKATKVYNKQNNRGIASTARSTRGNKEKLLKISVKNKANKKYKASRLGKINEEGGNDIEAISMDKEHDSDINEDNGDIDKSYLIGKLKNSHRTRISKTNLTRKKTVDEKRSKTQVISEDTCKDIIKECYKRTSGSNKNNNGYSIKSMYHNNELQQQQQKERDHPKNKRKSQLNQLSPRRKRVASEKLYYWSSSSDDDFGLISQQSIHKSRVTSFTTTPTVTVATTATTSDNYDCGNNGIGSSDGKGLSGGSNNGEQYQKHGWIVGDSHKKLVTLLAIAKGNNKKVDLNSGVKSKATKKRN